MQQVNPIYKLSVLNLAKVGVGEDGELLLNRCNQANGNIKAIVGVVSQLVWVLDGAEWPAGLRFHVEGARSVPSACMHRHCHTSLLFIREKINC